MKTLVTGSAGHLGEALVRTLRAEGKRVVGLDILESTHTDAVGSITDRDFVRNCMQGVGTVLHAATLHKPHVVTHRMQDFIDTNVTGTLVLLEAAVSAGVGAFVLTSTTSAFGRALRPPLGQPAVWVTEELRPVPRNVYGVTKVAAEDLCHLFHERHGLACVVLRTSRFFPEEDDDDRIRVSYEDGNVKANEFLFRRVDLEDVVRAHLCAAGQAEDLGFDRFIVSATTPFLPGDLPELRVDAPAVLARRVPEYAKVYERQGWRMFPGIDRVYDNRKARTILGWRPVHDFRRVIESIAAGRDPGSALSREVGSKGYHREAFAAGPYPVQ